MNNSKNTNTKDSIIEESKEYENNSVPLNSNINNACNINLGKTIYYFKDITDAKSSFDNFLCTEKKDMAFTPCDILQNHSIDVNNAYDSRLLILNVKLKNVCPNKLLVIGILVYENDKLYTFKAKKFSTLGLSHNKCKNIDAGKFSFLFYDKRPFNHKKLKVKFIYDYVMF